MGAVYEGWKRSGDIYLTKHAFELLDKVVITSGYRKGRIGFIHTIKCNHDGCVYYIRFHDIKSIVPYNAHELRRRNEVWVKPEKVVFT